MLSKAVRLGAVGVLAAGALTAVIAASTGTAGATGQTACVPRLHNNTDGVTLIAGGKASATAGGLLMETTVNDDAVVWKRTLPVAMPLGLVGDLSYRTRKLDNGTINAAALPAYRLYLEGTDGPNETTTLVYEPYWQPDGTSHNVALNTTVTWDVDAGKWWSTKAIQDQAAGSGGPPFKTLAEVVAKNPNARVVAYGVGQGTYNPGTKATANEVKFAGKALCEVHTWVAAPPSSASSSATTSASASSKPPTSSTSSSKPPSGSVSASASGSSTPTTLPTLGGGGTGGLPKTGVPVASIAVGGAGAVLMGVGVLWLLWIRRNRGEAVQFEA